jgi:hypothetical protein
MMCQIGGAGRAMSSGLPERKIDQRPRQEDAVLRVHRSNVHEFGEQFPLDEHQRERYDHAQIKSRQDPSTRKE